MKATKEYTKSERPQSGFYNVLLQRIYAKVDGIDTTKIDRVIEVLTISQLKDLSVDVAKYGIKNDQGLACRFENTRNYCFPVDAMSKLLDAADHDAFKKNYERACKELEKQIAEEKKANDPVRKAVMQVVQNATVKTTEAKNDPVKSAIADVIPLNATVKSEKAEKVQDPVKVETEKKAPAKVLPLDQKIIVSGSPKVKKVVEKAINEHLGKSEEKKPEEKKEEKKQENKPVDPVVTKSVTIDAGYIDKLIAAAPVAKKSKTKKSIKKSDLEQIAALF